MKMTTSEKAEKRKFERGLTVIELLVAMTVFMIVMASVYGILKIGNMSRASVNTRSENIKNVRMAINTIGREAVNAGLGYNRIGGTVPDDFSTVNFALPADADDGYDLLTAVSAGFNITESDLSVKGEKNDVVAFAFRDFQFNDGFPIIINDIKENGDHLILQTPDGACASCRPYDLFLLETGEGKQALVLSTDIVNHNQIVLGGGDADPLKLNFGKGGTGGGGGGDYVCTEDDEKNNSEKIKKACKEVYDAQKRVDDIVEDNDPSKVAELAQRRTELRQAQDNLNALTGSGSPSSTGDSAVKKCKNGETTNCINYGSTTVVAKKIYLVSYSVNADGTLIRTTFANNTGAASADQIVRQPIANGVRSFKVKYLLSDGTVTEDPSVANTRKERCNEIIQVEVRIVVDSEINSDPITLTSTFSTRNLKYDVY